MEEKKTKQQLNLEIDTALYTKLKTISVVQGKKLKILATEIFEEYVKKNSKP